VLSLLCLLSPATLFLCLYASSIHSIVLTIMHFDNTSTISLHISDLRKERFWLLKTIDKGTQGKRFSSQDRTAGTVDSSRASLRTTD
jgi:hypothetical protein